MGIRHRFIELKQYASKELAFDQQKYLPSLVETMTADRQSTRWVEGGVCAGLTVGWLSEKIRGARGMQFYRTKLFAKPSDDGTRAALAERAMLMAGTRQAAYAAGGALLEPLFESAGLDLEKCDLEPHTGETVLHENFFRLAADKMAFPCGRGIALSVTVDSDPPGIPQGHLVGMYRSNGTSLYFFDANAGLYKVLDPLGFITGWVDAYAALGKHVSLRRAGHGYGYPDGFYLCTPL